MYIIYLLSLMMLFVNLSWAQNPDPNQYTFTLNEKSITPAANFQKARIGLKAQQINNTHSQVNHFILQFNSLPTLEEQKQLKPHGINLLNYVQGNAYFVSVTSGFYNIEKSASTNLRSLIDIKPEYKINAELASGKIPEYAAAGENMVKIVVSYFKDVNDATVIADLSKLKTSHFKILKIFNQFSATISRSDIYKLASMDWVQNIEMAAPPKEIQNDHGRSLHRANVLNSTIPGLGFGLTGKGVKIGLWDTDVENHRDFNGRVSVRESEMHTTDHGTHTCGTITSAGLLDPKALGMAPEATVYSWNFNVQSNGLSVEEERILSLDNDGIEITSNSWGNLVGTCPSIYAYYAADHNDDRIACLYPYFLYVFSAGNDQSICLTSGGYHTTSKNIKNSLVCAAIDEVDNISSFSSFGPSRDGRLIPNISGDGVSVYSDFFNNGYGLMSGTSMATPGIAGTMVLVYQRYKETHGGQQPISALMRGLACNTSHDLGNPGPDYKYGYGEINGLRAVEVMEQNNYFINTVSQGTNYSLNITVPAGAVELKVMLSWTDPAGTVGSSRILINNLDLSVTNGGIKTLPWVLDPANPSANAVRGIDNQNILEQVTLSNPAAGPYQINVAGTQVPEGIQEFAVVYDIAMPSLQLTYPIGGEFLTPGNQAVIRWDCEGYTNPFTLEYSADGGVNYSNIASNIASTSRSCLWTIPSGSTTSAGKIRISNGLLFNVGKGSFNVMPVPQNVKIASAQCSVEGPYTMQWDAVANASYEILKLDGQIYKHLADATSTFYNIGRTVPDENNWYCIRAIDLTTGAISQRSLAVTLQAAAHVTSLPFREKFESQSSANFCITADKGQANVRYVNDSQHYGIRLEGTSGATTDWVAGTDTACFTRNPSYVVKASICNIDASSVAGKNFRLRFDYRQKYRTAAGTSYFRVKVNEDYLTNTEGTQIYGITNQVSYKSVYYDLSAYAGLPSVSVVFEAVCKTSYSIYLASNGYYDFSDDTLDKGDFVTIDNLEISEVVEDMAMTSLNVSSGFANAETISVKIKNLSGSSVINIPVSYSINGSTIVSESIPGPVDQMAEVAYVFTTKADFSIPGLYTVNASVNIPNDPLPENNTLAVRKINNGTDIVIGIDSGTVTTCAAVVVDQGGRYGNYRDNLDNNITFKPGSTDKNMKITFTEFATEQDCDFLYVYSGTSASAPNLLGMFSGNTLPPSITSLAPGGELYLRFTSDTRLNYKGFVATIECVNKTIDAALTEITAPSASGLKTSAETVTVTVSNPGIPDLFNADVYYQIDNNTPVHEQVDTIVSLTPAKSYSFKTKADLSIPGTYTLKAWIVVPGDVFDVNNLVTVNITSTSTEVRLKDVGISAISTIYPKRLAGANSSITATLKNYGAVTFKDSIKMTYTIDGDPPIVENYPVTIDAGTTKTFTFATKADLSAPDHTYHIDVYAKAAGDEYPANDHSTATVATPAYSATNVIGTFNGILALVTAPPLAAVDLMKDYTVEFWVNPSDPIGFGRIFDKTNVTIFYQTDYSVSVYPKNSYMLFVTTETGTFTYYYPGTVRTHQWQHLALTADATGDNYIFYINGVAQTPEIYSGTAAATKTNSTAPLCLGNRLDLTRGTAGSIDEVRVWNSCLTQKTIASNMMTDYPAGTAGMLAYYKFIEANGNYLYDYSSNDNTAYISGTDVSGMGDGKFWNNQTPLLHNYGFTGEVIPTTFNAATNTFTSIVLADTDLSKLTANFSVDQNSLVTVSSTPQVAGKSVNNFKGTVDYLVAGTGFNTGITQTYHVNVTGDLNSDCDLTAFNFETAINPGLSGQIGLEKNGSNFYKKVAAGIDRSGLKASYIASSGSLVYINGIQQTSPQLTAMDYTHPLMATVISENGRTFQNYSIVLDSRSSEADLTAFSIPGKQVAAANIDRANHGIGLWVSKITDLKILAPAFSVSADASVYVNNVTQWNGITTNNFTHPLVYRVVSEDESVTRDWNVTVKVDDTKPVITLAGDNPMKVAYGSLYTDPGATALDNVNGDITPKIVVAGSVNTNLIGAYSVTYNVNDVAGNQADEVTRITNVVKAGATVEITGLLQSFNGNPMGVIVTTVPPGLRVIITYDGASTVPFAIGKYAVVATIDDVNYEGKNNALFKIAPKIEDGVRIYSDGISIYASIKKIRSGAHLSVLAINGKTVYQTSALSEGVNRIFHNLNSGGYIIRLQVDGKRYTAKVVLVKN